MWKIAFNTELKFRFIICTGHLQTPGTCIQRLKNIVPRGLYVRWKKKINLYLLQARHLISLCWKDTKSPTVCIIVQRRTMKTISLPLTHSMLLQKHDTNRVYKTQKLLIYGIFWRRVQGKSRCFWMTKDPEWHQILLWSGWNIGVKKLDLFHFHFSCLLHQRAMYVQTHGQKLDACRKVTKMSEYSLAFCVYTPLLIYNNYWTLGNSNTELF